MLGAEVVKVSQTLRTHRHRAEPTLVESVGRYWLYYYELVSELQRTKISVAETTMTLPLTPFPALLGVERERAE